MGLERETKRIRLETGNRPRNRGVHGTLVPVYSSRGYAKEVRRVNEKNEVHLQKQVALLAMQESREVLDRRYSSTVEIVQMMDMLKQTSKFREIVVESKARLANGEDYLTVKSDRNGALFENLVHEIVGSECPDDLTALSPDRAFKVAKMMYPDARESYGGLSLLHGLLGDGVYVPDGFLVAEAGGDKSILLASVESSMLTNEHRFNTKFKNKYSRFRQAKRSFGELTNGMQMMVVIPDNGFTPAIAEKPDVALVKLNFTSQDFASLANELASL